MVACLGVVMASLKHGNPCANQSRSRARMPPLKNNTLEDQDLQPGFGDRSFLSLTSSVRGVSQARTKRGNGRPYKGEVFTTPLANPMSGNFSQDSGYDGRCGVPRGSPRRPGGDWGRAGRGGACGRAAIGIAWGPILPGARPSGVAQDWHVGCRVSRPRVPSDPLGGEFPPCLRPKKPSVR